MAFKTQTSILGNPSIELVEHACRIILDEHRRVVATRIEDNELKLRSDGHCETDRHDASIRISHGSEANANFPKSFLHSSASNVNVPKNSSHSSASILGNASIRKASTTRSKAESTRTRTVFFEDLVPLGTKDLDALEAAQAPSLPASCLDSLEFSEWSKRISGRYLTSLFAEQPVVYPKMVAKTVQAFAMASGWVGHQATVLGSQNASQFAIAKSFKLVRINVDGWFDSTCALLIVLNAVLMGVAVNYAAANNIGRDMDMPIGFIVSEYAFTAWFVVELIIRMLAVGPCKYFSVFENSVAWNYFDLTVVLMNVIESIAALTPENGGADLTSLRALRILRVAKHLRLFRLVRLFRALRKMVLSVLGSFTALFWALLLLMIMIFVFGLFLTEQVNKHMYRDAQTVDEERNFEILKRWFGSLWLAQYTLFLSISGGINWEVVSDALFGIQSYLGLSFCFYIFFTMFAMLNIITGIFVDIAISAAQGDKDECIAEQLHSRDSAIRQMQRLFDEVDYDSSGVVNEEEFNKLLTNPDMLAHLASLGIDVCGAEGLFRLLDMDNSGSITPEEFLVGCMRMRGNAKALDVITLMYENKRMVDRWGRFMRYVADQFKVRHDFENRCLKLMKDLIASIRLANFEDTDPLWL